MSTITVIPWLPVVGNEAAIAPLQSAIVAGGSLKLNSLLSSHPEVPYVFDRVIRKVMLTSTLDLSGVNFTLSGIGSPVDGDGNPTQVLGFITETIAGPDNTEIETNYIFSQVYAITVDAAVPANSIKVGFGASGITDYVFLDPKRIMFQASAQIQITGGAGITVNVYQSLNVPQRPNPSTGGLINFQPIPAFKVPGFDNVHINTLGSIQAPASLVWARISVTTNEHAYFTVLQQGIR